MAGQELLPSQELDYRDYHGPLEYSADEDDDETQVEEVTEVMTKEDVAIFLRDKLRIPQNYCNIFKDNYIDGREFLSLTEEEVKVMIPPIGLAKRIVRYLPSSKLSTPILEAATTSGGSDHSGHTDVQVGTNVSRSTSSSSTRTGGSSNSATVVSLVIPDNWRPEVMKSIKNKCITDSTRNEIVRVLANSLFSVSQKPSRQQCDEVAKKLILKFPSTKDELGNGYQSWSDRLVERIRNVIKRDRRKGVEVEESPVAKRPKKQVVLLSRYPVTTTATTMLCSADHHNDGSIDDHVQSMKTEMEKERPRDTLLSELMKLTYPTRRDFILNDITCVSEIYEKYPALKRPSMVVQEMGLIMNIADIKSSFMSTWAEYVPAILQYAKNSRKKVLSTLMKNMVYDDEDDVSIQVAALNVLAAVLGKGDDPLCYLYEEHSATQSSTSICRKAPPRSQPWFAAVISDSSTKYSIVCEQKEVSKITTIETALFVVFSLYYCLHLKYPDGAKWIYFFFQDFILQQPDRAAKSATHLSVTSDIKRTLLLSKTN